MQKRCAADLSSSALFYLDFLGDEQCDNYVLMLILHICFSINNPLPQINYFKPKIDLIMIHYNKNKKIYKKSNITDWKHFNLVMFVHYYYYDNDGFFI